MNLSKKERTTETRVSKKMSKREAKSVVTRLQMYIGAVLVLSAFFGFYLLLTDHSLWNLAVSHAYGLVLICVVDAILAVLSFQSVRQVYLPVMAWAILSLMLQLGDILTAPQYRMTMSYFASYLFGLWAFDALLVAQAVIVILGLAGRANLRYSADKKKVTFFDMGIKNSRRDFLQIIGTIGALLSLAGIMGVAEAVDSPPTKSSTTTQQSSNTLPSGAIANVNHLQSPVYFEYPSGNPSILVKNKDGSLTALSMLCTHVCCQCDYDQTSNEILCPCHGSAFSGSGNVLRGPAALPLPSIELSVDNAGNVFPKGVKGKSPCLQS